MPEYFARRGNEGGGNVSAMQTANPGPSSADHRVGGDVADPLVFEWVSAFRMSRH
jgi:hypothetical protein